MEIACDESGYEGEELIGTTTEVFAHASVALDAESAAACVRALRERIRSPATEYKANHVLRGKHRAVLTWLLGVSGPLLGHAHVFLIDKAFFVAGKLVDALLGDALLGDVGRPLNDSPDAMTVTLHREGPAAFGPRRWEAFLVACNDLMRVKDRPEVIDSFFHMVDVLRHDRAAGHAGAVGAAGHAGVVGAAGHGASGRVDEILDLLSRTRPRAESLRAGLLAEPTSVLDPLIPAILRAVAYWGEGQRPVHIVHDQQNMLSDGRVAHIMGLVPTRGLCRLRLADSFSEPRVQVADVLAGVARAIASDELNGRGDEQLTALLRPYVDSSSIWGDDLSWSRLALHG